MLAANYRSGDDFVVEFLGHRFEFSCDGLRGARHRRGGAARAHRLERPRRGGGARTSSSSSRTAASSIRAAASGSTSSGTGSACRSQNGESLVYWLRKLVFRGAWLDHRVKEGLLDVSWIDDTGDFGYAEPQGGRTLLELAPVPSWRELQYRG